VLSNNNSKQREYWPWPQTQ